MKNGYEVNWTPKASAKLNDTYLHLEEEWTFREVDQLAAEVERTVNLISRNPKIFQETTESHIRRAIVLKHNSIFFHLNERDFVITVIAFVHNRQMPNSPM